MKKDWAGRQSLSNYEGVWCLLVVFRVLLSNEARKLFMDLTTTTPKAKLMTSIHAKKTGDEKAESARRAAKEIGQHHQEKVTEKKSAKGEITSAASRNAPPRRRRVQNV